VQNQVLRENEIFEIFYVLSLALLSLRGFPNLCTLFIELKQNIYFSEKILSRKTHDSAETSNIYEFTNLKLNQVIHQWEGSHNQIQINNIDISEGDFIYLTGPNGAGKSTLAQIISGKISPKKIKALLNGEAVDISQFQNIMGQVSSYCSVEHTLFSGTPEENVCFYSKDPDDIENAKRLLAIVGFYESMNIADSNFKINLSKAGEGISRGQKQRVMVARALFKSPKILILDEATNGLDMFSELKLLEDLRQMLPSLTIIYIGHRTNSLIKDGKQFHIQSKKVFTYE
jgi:ATP-binding cassette subfamily B protein RaxB